MRIQLTDKAEIGGVRRTADGYLVAEARVARTGIQEYLASELGLADRDPDTIIRVYRPPEEVFSKDTMHSFAYRPMTNGHPVEPVSADNWRDVAVGQTGGEVVRDGEFVRVPLVLMDAQAIRDYEAGKRELSMGYTAEIVMRDGETPQGEKFDAIQRAIKNNHLSLEWRARGGSKLKIGDGNSAVDPLNPGGKPKHPSKQEDIMSDALKTVVLGDAAVQVAIADVAAIEAFKAAMTQKLADAETDKAKVVAAKDAEIARKDAEIDALKAKVLDDAAIDKLVQERADLIATAKAIADQDYTGKSAAEIRKAAVVAKLGDAAIKDKSPEYIAARFDILAEDAAKDPHRQVVAPSVAQAGTAKAMADSYNNYVADLNAWRAKEAK